jgi:hypothetical protein
LKTEVYYLIELSTNLGWIPQGLTVRTNQKHVENDIADWRREDPEAKLRLVRVTTTEEREVVG